MFHGILAHITRMNDVTTWESSYQLVWYTYNILFIVSDAFCLRNVRCKRHVLLVYARKLMTNVEYLRVKNNQLSSVKSLE